MGIEPILKESQSRVLTVTLRSHLKSLAEHVGIEPTHPLLNDRLAICCLNRSASVP